MMTTTTTTPASATATRATLAARRATSIRGARCARPTHNATLQRDARRARVEIACSATKTAHSYSHTNKKGLSAYVERASARQTKRDLIPFRVGMTLKVGVTVKEGNKTRVQPFEGVVIGIHRAGVATTVTVRKTLQGFGVERVFPVHSPLCTFEEVRGAGKPVVRILLSVDAGATARRRDAGRARTRDATRADNPRAARRGRLTSSDFFFIFSAQVRRAKLFYLRRLVGKQARLKTRFVSKREGKTRHEIKMEAMRAEDARLQAVADAEAAAAAAAAEAASSEEPAE